MDRIEQLVALEAEGRVTTGGLSGSWHRVDDLQRGRWRVDSDLGVFRTSEGDDGNVRWRQDPSGGVHPLNSDFMLRVRATESWLVRQGLQRDRGAVQFTPAGGEPVELWFDTETGLLQRTVMQMPTVVRTVRYDSYSQVDSSSKLLAPHEIETTESGSSRRELVQITRWRALRSVSDDRFAQPQAPSDSVPVR